MWMPRAGVACREGVNRDIDRRRRLYRVPIGVVGCAPAMRSSPCRGPSPADTPTAAASWATSGSEGIAWSGTCWMKTWTSGVSGGIPRGRSGRHLYRALLRTPMQRLRAGRSRGNECDQYAMSAARRGRREQDGPVRTRHVKALRKQNCCKRVRTKAAWMRPGRDPLPRCRPTLKQLASPMTGDLLRLACVADLVPAHATALRDSPTCSTCSRQQRRHTHAGGRVPASELAKRPRCDSDNGFGEWFQRGDCIKAPEASACRSRLARGARPAAASSGHAAGSRCSAIPSGCRRRDYTK